MLLIFWVLGVICIILIVGSLDVESEIDWRPKSNEISNTGSRIRQFLFMIAIICFIFIIVCGALFPTMLEISTYEKVTNRIEISNFQNGSIEKNIYISVNAKENYTYYYKSNDGGLVKKSINSSETKIYEEDMCEKPIVITYTVYEKEEMNEIFSKIMYFSTDNVKEKETGKRYEIHIPKGTIKY